VIDDEGLRRGYLFELPRVPLPLTKKPGPQPIAQFGAALAPTTSENRNPAPVLALHLNPHQLSLTDHLKEEYLAGDDVDGLATWRGNGPLPRWLQT
jgi:hypothetical protein